MDRWLLDFRAGPRAKMERDPEHLKGYSVVVQPSPCPLSRGCAALGFVGGWSACRGVSALRSLTAERPMAAFTEIRRWHQANRQFESRTRNICSAQTMSSRLLDVNRLVGSMRTSWRSKVDG